MIYNLCVTWGYVLFLVVSVPGRQIYLFGLELNICESLRQYIVYSQLHSSFIRSIWFDIRCVKGTLYTVQCTSVEKGKNPYVQNKNILIQAGKPHSKHIRYSQRENRQEREEE